MRDANEQTRLDRWMRDGIPVGSVAGVRVGLHPVMVMLAGVWLWLAMAPEGVHLGLDWFGFVILDGVFSVSMLLCAYLGSLLLHELAHVGALRLLHLGPRGLVLLPLGGGTRTPGGERSPQAELLVAVAAPTASLVLGVVATILHLGLPADIAETHPRGVMREFVAELAYINWLLFGLNLLVPVFPLACARIVRAVLSMRYEPQRTTYDLTLMGVLTVGLFGAASIAVHFLPGGSPYLGSSSLVLSILVAAAVVGGWESHREMRRAQASEVYSDPDFARPWLEGFLPHRQVEPSRAAAQPDAQASTGDPHPVTATPRGENPPSRQGLDTARTRRPVQPARLSKSPARPLTERESLMNELDRAVKAEDFLLAARLRDRIRSLEGRESRTP